MATTPAPVSPVPAETTQASMSPLGRIIGVLFSPKRTFQDIVRRPSWVAPTIVLTLLSILVSVAISQRVDWREVVGQQVEKNPASARMSAEQKQQRIEAGAKIAPLFAYAAGALGPIIFIVVIAAIMMGAYNLLAGASVSFGTSLAISAHAAMTGIVRCALFVLVLYLKPFGTVDLENPVAANLAAFLPDGSARWLVTLAKQIDLFTIWTLILLAIGFAAANPKKLKGSKAFAIAFGVWVAWAMVVTGVAFIFS